MKNCLMASFSGILLICVNSTSYPQCSAGFSKLNAKTSPENTIPLPKQLNPTSSSGFIFRNNINIKAVRHFIARYGDVSDVMWRQSESGPAAYFTLNDVKTSVYFSKKGNYQCMIQYYQEEKLPQYIRRMVKSRYYNFKIFAVLELSEKDRSVYEIKIHDKTSFKIIRVEDGEMSVTDEFIKAL